MDIRCHEVRTQFVFGTGFQQRKCACFSSSDQTEDERLSRGEQFPADEVCQRFNKIANENDGMSERDSRELGFRDDNHDIHHNLVGGSGLEPDGTR